MSLEDRLWRETRRWDFAHLPFLRAVHDGTCTVTVLQAYALDLATLAEGFPRQLSWILAHCDDRSVRHAVLANLLEEEGIASFRAHGGLIAPLNRSHGEMARRLARAFGADPDRPRRPLRSAWLDAALHRGNWLAALAFLTVGYEANVPAVFKLLVEGLRTHYGYSETDIEYLVMHVAADEEHGADGVAMVARLGATPEAERDALEGARRGTLAWYLVHRRHGQSLSLRRPS